MARFYCSTQRLVLSIAAACALLAGAGCHNAAPAREQALVSPPRNTAAAPSAGTQGQPIAPDPQRTPGATLPVTRDDICVPGYTQKVRHVPEALKRQVYAEYGIASHKAGDFEVDHLISLELGGSNSPKNLWPQSYKTQPWNAHVKDALENRLHDDVCTNQIDLPTAQREIATDWIGAYKRLFGTTQPIAEARRHRGQARATSYSRTPAAAPESSGSMPGSTVWVNTRSDKYFRPGSAHYGTTKQGVFMSEPDAVQDGYVAARGQ